MINSALVERGQSMRTIILSLLLLFPITSNASEQDELNSIYEVVGHEVRSTLGMMEASIEEISIWSTVADQLKVIEACDQNNNDDCYQSYQKMAVQLDPVVYSQTWTFLNRLSRLSMVASKSLQKMNSIDTSSLNQECNSKLIRSLKSIQNEVYLNYEKITVERGSLEMDTDQAMKFLKMVTKSGRSFSQYLNYEKPNQSTLIDRGREIHLAVRVIRMTLLNQPVSDELGSVAQELIKGCSE